MGADQDIRLRASERLRIGVALAREVVLDQDSARQLLGELRAANGRELALAARVAALEGAADLYAEHEALVARAERLVRRSRGAAILWGGVLVLLVILAGVVVLGASR